MSNVELPATKNTMLRKKKASDFISRQRMDLLGDSSAKRLVEFKLGQSGLAEPEGGDVDVSHAKRAKTSAHEASASD